MYFELISIKNSSFLVIEIVACETDDVKYITRDENVRLKSGSCKDMMNFTLFMTYLHSSKTQSHSAKTYKYFAKTHSACMIIR